MRRLLNVFALLSLALFGGQARADGLGFDGDVPLFPHVDLPLSAAQKQQLASDARKGVRYPELRLTRAQQAALKKEAGATVPWVFAVDRKTIGGECTCGSYNLAVAIGDRLAVYKAGLGDHLSPGEVKRIEAVLQGDAPPVSVRQLGGTPRTWIWLGGGSRDDAALEALAKRLPGGRFARTVSLPAPWRPMRPRLPELPRPGEESDQDTAAVFADPARITATPLGGKQAAWPEAGAKLESKDGEVIWMLPAIVPPGAGPTARAWLLLEYRAGNLVALLAMPEAGPSFGWRDEAP